MFESLVLLFFFLLGLAVGSHLNVLILRFGFQESSNPRSECAQCATVLRWYDLIPVLSFFFLKGRCRQCGSELSLQYPLVEIATGVLFGLTYIFYPPAFTAASVIGFLALLSFIAVSVVVFVYDIRHTLVPLPFVYAALAVALIYRLTLTSLGSWSPLFDGVLGMLALFGFFAAISLLTRGRGMGIGDAYVAGTIGMLLGVVDGINAVTLGVWSGTIFYIVLLSISHIRLLGSQQRVTMKTELPFAPWLFIGMLLTLFTDLAPFGVGQWLSSYFL